MNIIRLVPFKVIAKPPPEPNNTVSDRERMMVDYAHKSQYIWNKEWTVVSINSEGFFLLIRSGDIAQWYPREFCEVIGE